MQHATLAPEIIVAEAIFVLIVLIFIGFVAGAIISMIDEHKENSKSDSKANPSSKIQ